MLTHPKIQAAIKAGKRQRLADGQGLLLAIMPSGSASWILRVQSGGRRHDVGLGGYPRLTLRDARQKARERRETVKAGDPVARKRPTMPTFAEAARAALECRAKAKRWRGSATARDWWASIENHCGPILARPVNEVSGGDVLAVLEPLMDTHPSLAQSLRQRIRSTFAVAKLNGHVRGDNAAGEGLDAFMPTHEPTHHAALNHADVGDALRAVDATPSGEAVTLAVRFIALTATRSGEARGARWSEIDLQARTWTLPASRTKTARQHRIPLSDAAMDTLAKARPLGDGENVFPSPVTGGPLDPKALRLALAAAGVQATLHGMRSSFADWCAETGVAFDVAELSLGHAFGSKVARAYRRTDQFEARRGIMQAWGEYIEGETVAS